MAFDQRFLDELNARCDIVDIVSRYVQLKKSGSSYFGLCPFHSEKSGSFAVSPDKQIFHCFGCGAGGGVVTFIMKIEGLGYGDAIRFLAKEYGLAVVETNENKQNTQRRERLLSLCRESARFFYDELQKEENSFAKEYLLNRGLSKKTMNNFGLGFAPNSYNALMNEMLDRGYTKTELFDAGLLAKSEKGTYYDRFRNRIIFPIIDIRGNVIAFGGRVMDDSKPKYLNSPETLLFSKSHNLFALNIAKKTRDDFFILAEGYMDVIALHQAGFDSAVASLGTSLTDDQARLISRYTNHIVISYDADGAGQAAAQRAIDILKKSDISVKVIRIPGAKDPDQFIKENGPDAYRRILDKSENHIEYRLESVKSRYNLKEDEQKIEFLHEAANIISSIDNAIEREVYTGRAAKMADVSINSMDIEVKMALRKRLNKDKKSRKREIRAPISAVQPKAKELRYEDIKSARAEEGIIALIFADDTLSEYIDTKIKPSDFTAPVLRKIFKESMDIYYDGEKVHLNHFEGILDEHEIALLSNILQKPVPMASREKVLDDYISTIHIQNAKRNTDAAGNDALEEIARTHREKKGFGGYKR